jgi:predicted MFS family arabinose efflux permease
MSSQAKTRSAWAIMTSPGAPSLFASSIVARLPLAMFGVALLVHVQRLTGSFAVAGIVTGAYAIARGVGAPVLGGFVDRWGQTRVLVLSSIVSSALLMIVATLPGSAPAALLVAMAGAIGFFTPPLGACMRTLLPEVLGDASHLRAAYALETSVLELTFIFGPPLALGVGALWSTGAALALGGLVLVSATLAFAAQPASRRWRPQRQASRQRGGSLRASAMRTLVLILLSVGTVFGAVDVGVTAATKALGSTVAAGPLLGLWGAGSLVGGILATRRGGGAQGSAGLAGLLAALALGHGLLAIATGSVVAIGLVVLLAGATIAPTTGSIYALADRAAPEGTRTEAFAWLLTAISLGSSLGAIVAGALAQAAGATTVFAFAGTAGMLAVAVALARAETLDGSRSGALLCPEPVS